MRLKELRGLPVIDPTAARKIGTVSDYQVDPANGRLAALDLDGSDGRGAERVLAQRIRRVGANAVILNLTLLPLVYWAARLTARKHWGLLYAVTLPKHAGSKFRERSVC